MIFKCRNCGGNTIYSPDHKTMFCPYCNSTDSEEKQAGAEEKTVSCPSCGGALDIREYMSAFQCPYCDSYLIADERVTGDYTPQLMIPFFFSKEKVKGLMREKFKKAVFTPSDFFSDVKLDSMKGMYVPFWLYDYHVHGRYEGTGKKIRTWVSGNRSYTETSVYRIKRDMEVEFEKMPVDASLVMPDATMDLMEPFQYREMEGFREAFLSGFSAECYNLDALACERRALDKAKEDASNILKQSISGYTGMVASSDNTVTMTRTDSKYALLPVWIYNYVYKNETYTFHINGQTGKIVGKLPLSVKKVWAYGATMCATIFTILFLVRQIIGML